MGSGDAVVHGDDNRQGLGVKYVLTSSATIVKQRRGYGLVVIGSPGGLGRAEVVWGLRLLAWSTKVAQVGRERLWPRRNLAGDG